VKSRGRDLLDEIVARFHRRHEELYAYSAPGQEVVVVNARVAVVGELPPLATGRGDPVRRDAPKAARRRVWLGDWVEVPGLPPRRAAAGWETKGRRCSSRRRRRCSLAPASA